MSGLTTEEIMQIALDLPGETEIPADSGIHHPGKNIRRVLFTMDVNVGLLLMARQLGYDAVIGHHPCGVELDQGEEYRRHIDLLVSSGVPRKTAVAAVGEAVERFVRRSENKRYRMLYSESPNQTVLEVDSARLLDLPLMNIHNLFDEMGRRILQQKLDEAASRNPDWTLADVVRLIEALPEARQARNDYQLAPKCFLGDPHRAAGRVVFAHGALSAPNADIVRCYWQNGIETVVALHGDFDTLERLRQSGGGNLIFTGHFVGDSIGMTPFIAALRRRGVEVTCVGGIIDAAGDARGA